MTTREYLYNTYKYEHTATILNIVEMDDTIYLYCDSTIFYPQGGGQPCDVGIIGIGGEKYRVYHVENTEEGIAHIVESHPLLLKSIGMKCEQKIDQNRRLVNAKAHTAGHLISHIIEEMNINLMPAKGHHYHENAYVELLENEHTDDSVSIDYVNSKINEIVNQSPRYIQSTYLELSEVQSLRPLLSKVIPQSADIRMVTIEGYIPVPCGGTHVNSTSELKGLQVTRIKRKKDKLKINYTIIF